MWNTVGSDLLYFFKKINNNNKIAAFDLDSTLIKTKSGRTFPTDHNDWQLWSDNISEILKKLQKNGFQIMIFSNQSRLKKEDTKNLFKQHINNS